MSKKDLLPNKKIITHPTNSIIFTVTLKYDYDNKATNYGMIIMIYLKANKLP